MLNLIRNGRRAWRVGYALLILGTAWWLAWVAARGLYVSEPLTRADALVVLSGSAAYTERTRTAAQLYHQGRAPIIILTNDNLQGAWSNEDQRNPYFVERATAELRDAGVPAESIIVLQQPVTSTYDEGLVLFHDASARRMRSLLVVTSAYHSRRALWTFRHIFAKSGIEIGLDPVPPGQQTPQPSKWWLASRGWNEVALEYPKLVYYWFRYN